MLRFPYTETGLRAALVAIPVVFLLVWLFNTYKMHKLRHPDDTEDRIRQHKNKRYFLLLAAAVLVLIAGWLLIAM